MKESDIKVNIIPILTGNCTLCLFSIIVNIIEICIILSLKFLQSILYRLFFFISISEIVNCIFHIVQSFLIMLNSDIRLLYNINSFFIYFTDNFSLILLACLCDSMNGLILKQNKKISSNQSYKLFSFIFAMALTIIYFILFIIKYNDDKYKYIHTELISWKFMSNEKNINEIEILSLSFFSYLITIILYFLIVVYSFYLIFRIQCFIVEKKQDETKSKNWKKLNEFIFKMIKYPLFGAIWVLPLIIYSLFEIIKKSDTNIKFLRIKYTLFFIFSFISSIRGVLFFKLFISNEKIKKFIQYKIKNVIFLENILQDEIFEIIDNNNSNTITDASTKSNKTSDGGSKNTLFREGLVDDRDMKKDRNDDDDSSDSDDEKNNDNNLNAKNSINTVPDDNNIYQSFSSLSENKKDNISNSEKKNPLKISGFNE